MVEVEIGITSPSSPTNSNALIGRGVFLSMTTLFDVDFVNTLLSALVAVMVIPYLKVVSGITIQNIVASSAVVPNVTPSPQLRVMVSVASLFIVNDGVSP